jgi:hypothetical protein
MKNKKIVELFNNLSDLNLKGVKFAYAVARNISILKPHVESLGKAQQPTEEYQKFEKERIALAQKHAKKDDQGEAVTEDVIQNGVVVKKVFVLENKEAFLEEVKDIQEKHKEAIDAWEAQLKEFDQVLEKEEEIKLYKIKIEDVPEEITSQQMTHIFDLIED